MPQTSDTQPRPLTGITIAEFSAPDASIAPKLSRALAGRIAADMGARVLLLEPAGGEVLRRMPPFLPDGPEEERSALFQFLNAGKTLFNAPSDLQHRAEAAALIAARADVVLCETGDPAIMSCKNGPALVEIGCWPVSMGKAVPRASEFTLIAMSGLLDIVGEPDREPLKLGGHQGAYPAGLAAFTALMAQIMSQEVGLSPKPARISVLETLVWSNWKAICAADIYGSAPTRQGSQGEFQTLRCRDGWIAFVYTVTQYNAVCDLIGDSRLSGPRFATREARNENIGEFFSIVSPWFASRSRQEIYAEAQSRGVPIGPVYEMLELLEDPQYLSRSFIAEIEHPELGNLHLPHLPVEWNGKRFTPSPTHRTQGDTTSFINGAVT